MSHEDAMLIVDAIYGLKLSLIAGFSVLSGVVFAALFRS